MEAAAATTSEAAEKIKGWLNEEIQEPADPPTEEVTELTEPEVEPEVKTFRIKVDGEEIEVPEDEVLKGYSRTSDYTRKTQKLAEERKALEVEAERVKSEREEYQRALETIKTQFTAGQEPDWQKLYNEDPIEFLKQKEVFRDRKERLTLIEQEQRRIAELQSQEQQKALSKYLEVEQSKLLDALPEWKDANKAKAEKEKIAAYAVSLGFTEAEVAQIFDHRAVVTLRKAALYDEMMSGAKAKVEKAKDSPKTAKPGTPQSANRTTLAARDQFQKSGNVRDAGAFIKQLMRT